VKLSDIFIGNDTEIAQLKTLFDLDIETLLEMGIKAVIETKGEKGVSIHSMIKGTLSTTDLSSIKPTRVLETTGAGDAFRSGLIYGLVHDKTIVESCKIGTYMGAKCVEEYSGQMYKIDLNLINKN
jgi:adenosine kinase